VGLNFESRGSVKSMCLRGLIGLLSRTQDEEWVLLNTILAH